MLGRYHKYSLKNIWQKRKTRPTVFAFSHLTIEFHLLGDKKQAALRRS